MTTSSTLTAAELAYVESRAQALRLRGCTQGVAMTAANQELRRLRIKTAAELAARKAAPKPATAPRTATRPTAALSAPRPAPASKPTSPSAPAPAGLSAPRPAPVKLTPYQVWRREHGKPESGLIELTAADVHSMGAVSGRCLAGGLIELR